MILAGKVRVEGQNARQARTVIATDARIEVEAAAKYVSRAGAKLEAALSHFHVSVAGKICMDVGTSTGGFTDCLLQSGAARVHAVDTGAGQIAWSLRSDARVVLHERCNARYLTFEEIGEPVDLIACDVSFISVTLLIPALMPFLRAERRLDHSGEAAVRGRARICRAKAGSCATRLLTNSPATKWLLPYGN